MSIFGNIISVFIIFIPIYLWAFAVTIFDGENMLNRVRFWIGMASGAISVTLVYLITHFLDKNIFVFLFVPLAFFVLLYVFVLILIAFGNEFAKGFLRKIVTIHSVWILVLLFLTTLISYLFSDSVLFATLVFPVFFAAFFEETTKHLSTVGLLAKDFRFSHRQLSFFTFFVVLGFVFFENIFYVFEGGYSIGITLYRSIFTFSAHLFAALICTFFWWKALSEKFFSIRYLVYFFAGFLLAIVSHTLYNIFLSSGNIFIIFPYMVATFWLFTWSIRR